MIKQALHKLQVARFTQNPAGEIMPEIVEAESDDASAFAQPPPRDLHARIGEGIALALHTPIATAFGDIGEDKIPMVPL